MDFDGTMEILAARECAMAKGGLVRLLRHDAYFHLLNPKGSSGASQLEAAFERYRTLLASYAAVTRPDVLADGPAHGDGILNGMDVGPDVLRSLAEAAVAWGREVWDRAAPGGFAASIADGGNVRDGAGGSYADRYLTLRLMSAAKPEAFRGRIGSDAAFAASARALGGWWAGRLRDLARAPDRRVALAEGQDGRFEEALAAIACLTRTRHVQNGFEPCALLKIALFDAGLPEHALDGWRHSATTIGSDGTVIARVGDAAPCVVAGPHPVKRELRVA